MAATNFVLAAGLKLQHDYFLMAVLGDNLPNDFGADGVFAGDELLLVISHGQNIGVNVTLPPTCYRAASP